MSGINIDKLWKTIRELEKQLRRMTELKTHMNGNYYNCVRHRALPHPYLGYTPLYPKIKNASVACSLM